MTATTMFYELATLYLNFKGDASACAKAVDFSRAASGTLVGAWRPEFGPLNTLLLLRAFESAEALVHERQRIRMHRDPFGCRDVLLRMKFETFAPIRGFEVIPQGHHGPLYEIRSYRVLPGHLADLVSEWSAVKTARDSISKMLLVMYALDGSDRLVHIWPYAHLEERGRARTKAWMDCPGWPPPSGIRSLDPQDMRAGLFLPIEGSPLT